MDCFSVRAEGYEANEASAGEPDGVLGYCWEVEVFGCRVEEGEGGTVDARTEGRARPCGHCVDGLDRGWSGLSKTKY